MTSRKRNKSSNSVSGVFSGSRSDRSSKKATHLKRRQNILETLEARQLLAGGPYWVGTQPNTGELITDNSTVETAPRVLTLRFDEDQRLDPDTLDAVKISRAGDDGQLGTQDDVEIIPGLVSLGDDSENEIIVRFSESLPDDRYKIEVFGFDDPAENIVGLRNLDGDLLEPRVEGQRVDVTRFDLKLGALIESVVVQPVIRLDDGSLTQNRNEIVVYFNEDPLFFEDDENGQPTIRSVEHPRFYQLLLTQETVRNTDDALYHPESVVYDEISHTARLFFADDLNELGNDADGNSGVALGGGTFRLRVGTAVDDRLDLILPPVSVPIAPSAITDFGIADLQVTFTSTDLGEDNSGRRVRFEDTGSAGLEVDYDAPTDTVIFNLGGSNSTINDLNNAVNDSLNGVSEIVMTIDGAGTEMVPRRVIGAPALRLVAVGEMLETSLDVGVFGQDAAITSLILSEAIDAQPFLVEPPGGGDDPGHTDEVEHINPLFDPRLGAPSTDGITEVSYNFQGIFQTTGGNHFLNQITEVQKTRIKEALGLWASKIGVQFRETQSDGITFAVGDNSRLQASGGVPVTNEFALNARLRIDPNYQESAMVFDSGFEFGTDYGEDFTRKAVAGIGLLLGLEHAPDLPAPTIMSFDSNYLNASIDQLSDLEPVFPNNYDVLHGQYLHNTDSVDIDLYRFVVDLDDATQVGTLTAETFAERLPDSSLLDTALTLFEETSATVSTDFGLGSDLDVRIRSLLTGRQGNNSRLSFVQSDRASGDTEIKVLRLLDRSGNEVPNGVLIDLPRVDGTVVTGLTAGDVVDAINDDAFASSIFRATVAVGDASSDIKDADLATFSPLLLSGGGLERLHRNDDYFGEDSRIVASLGEGVYYLGVSASGNDQYDPTIAGSGSGGRTQGLYDLHLKFEPQVDEVDVIRDQDSDRPGVPGTPIDADGDGTPGGAHNFWFKTRPLDRMMVFDGDGTTVVPGQIMTITGGNGVVKNYQFVLNANDVSNGNIAVEYQNLQTFDAEQLAQSLISAIRQQTGPTGVSGVVDAPAGGPVVLTLSGERSVAVSNNFRGTEILGRTIFVDKTAGPDAEGTLAQPFNNINNPSNPNAFESSSFGDIVRIVGNGGLDGNIATEHDNYSYQIGTAELNGAALVDGRTMNVPRGVTTMIDAGAAFKLRNSYISVGSSTTQIDRSGGSLQVLGTPRLVTLSVQGQPISTTVVGSESAVGGEGFSDGKVIFTSLRDRDVDAAVSGFSPEPEPGNWGGLLLRRDIDQFEGRRDLEDDGIFMQRINHADIRYGGGSSVLIDSVQQLVNPVQIVDMRPTVTFNSITRSADSAISAAPNSFAETSFQAPTYQRGGAFTADYDRVGPEMHNNLLLENSQNGLFIRVTTTPVDMPKEFTVAARFDDTGLVHYVAENLKVMGSPGGSIQDGFAPVMALVSSQRLSGGTLEAETYRYKMTFVDADGFESLESADHFEFTLLDADSTIELTGLPIVSSADDYVSRRLYRAQTTGGGDGLYRLVGELDGRSVGFVDSGDIGEALLDESRLGMRGRSDASLVMDPGLIVKLGGARIEMGQGTQILAEGGLRNPIVFTSVADDRFGAGGTFDTNNDNNLEVAPTEPTRGDWSGIYASPTSYVGFDHVQLSYAGGISLLSGGLAKGFLPLELQQAEARITNSRFEFNNDGTVPGPSLVPLGAGPDGRFGRLAVTPATIMVRGSQPIMVGNTFVDNRGSIIDIDIESMGGNYHRDAGRQTGPIDRFGVLDHNMGPMLRFNRYLNDVDSGLQLSGVEIRGGMITTETVFDDTDIAHLLFDGIEVGNFHSSGGLRLLSQPDESLVLKFTGPSTPNSATAGTGITATGSYDGTADRIGGAVHVVGYPGAPVILTSFSDDSAGAGLKPSGASFTDHDGDANQSRAFANDWRGITLDQFSNDANIAIIPELELLTEVAPGLNSTVDNAQFIGELAKNVSVADHVRRVGIEVDGYLSGNNDIDTYSFVGSPGSEVWVDVDSTTFTVDTVVEVLDANGNVLARSDNSFAETAEVNPTPVTVFDPRLDGVTTSLQASAEKYTERSPSGQYKDFKSTNLRDAGIHFALTGDLSDPSARSVYFVRIRSASLNADDANGGLTGGQYHVQIRLTEEQAFPGSSVRYADIRYANNGIHVQGLMSDSPLLGEAQENEAAVEALFLGDIASNDAGIRATPGQGPQYIGDMSNNRRGVISVGGALSSNLDVDLYQFQVDPNSGLQSTVFDVDFADGFNRPDTNISVFFDADGVPAFEGDSNDLPKLVFFGSASNVLDDLTSPNGENDALEKLVRGSISNGDPFVGPVTLPSGTYYVAITADGRTPFGLNTAIVEPINSVDRIVEDRVDRGASAEPFSTADGPLLNRLFNDADLGASAFGISVDTAAGHGKPDHFDGTTGLPPIPDPLVIYPEGVIAGATDAANDISTDPMTPNIGLGSLDAVDWSLADNPEIGDEVDFFGISQNTSTTIPNVSVLGSFAGDLADFYQLDLAAPAEVIIDVDGGYNPSTEFDTDGDPATPPVNLDPTSVDTKLVVLEDDPANPGFLRIVTEFDDPVNPSFPIQTLIDDNDRFDNAANGLLGSDSEFDPFLQATLPAGTYFIGVLGEDTDLTFSNTGVTTSGTATSGSYRLHVSVEDHVVPMPGVVIGMPPGSGVISFSPDGTPAVAQLGSQQFSLAGYVAEDLPTLYFNAALASAPGDIATLTITSNESTTPLVHNFVDKGWDQIRISLADFAGHTGVQLQVEYQASGTAPAIGLRLDDFIVGFEERGVTVFNATSGTGFTGSGNGVAGEYQLEMRKATDFASRAGSTTVLTESFDTNDRHNQSVTIVAPEGNLINDGDRFTLGDGASIQTFEFDSGNGVRFGNTRISYDSAFSAAQVAEAMRFAINQQNVVSIEASTSGGLDGSNGLADTPTDGRLALHGVRTGSFEEVNSSQPADLPLTLTRDSVTGLLQVPAILHDGLGDSNFERLQGVVIVDHNEISDVRGVGVWSEPGTRDSTPDMVRNNLLLVAPPVGNAHPGAVLNLPELNDSVLGGLAPGIVIENNTIDQAEYAGIKIDGQTAPWVIEVGTGDTVTDGSTFVIDAAGTRVIFEFEEIGDGEDNSPTFPRPYGGEQHGGDGVTDGHVPVFYRHNDDFLPAVYRERATEYTSLEMLHAIRESIQGSILMSNGLSELVEVSIGPSLTSQVNGGGLGGFFDVGFATPALYIEGASAIYGFGGVTAEIDAYQAPIYEAPQPFAQIVNNTIYGNDGLASASPQSATNSEPNDFLRDAIETRIGQSHRDVYLGSSTLGDNSGPLGPAGDVDFYRVHLEVGDRLVADVDTLQGGIDTVLRIFDSSGIAQSFVDGAGTTLTVSQNGVAPGYLNPAGTPEPNNGRDPFIDFIAPKSGMYFVGVSSAGNEDYDSQTLSGRVEGSGGVGDYALALQSYTPRSFVMSLANSTGPNGERNTDQNFTSGADLLGATFTITQIEDIPNIALTPHGDGTNRVTFEFTSDAAPILPNGNISVQIAGNSRVPDIMRAIDEAINRRLNGLQVLSNFDFSDLNAITPGAVLPGEAQALGGRAGDGAGLSQIYLFDPANPLDFNTGGFGHATNAGNFASNVPDTPTYTAGSTELYALIEKVARIELSPAAIAGGLRLDPESGRDTDQLINETGVMIAGGASPTVLNNVFMNLHESLVVEETMSALGFGALSLATKEFFDGQPKPMEAIVVGNVFQDSDGEETLAQGTLGVNHGTSTNRNTPGASDRGTSNVNGGVDDFNVTLNPGDLALQYPEANNFQPDLGSFIIDSSVSQLIERVGLVSVKNSVGLPASNILAPTDDVGGVVRADNTSSPGGGQGGFIFNDRGSTELADFVGPVAIAELPRDNDASQLDSDPSTGFINLTSGTYREFRIQLRDNGDASDPFTGIGIDDSTVVVPEIPGLRPSGANITLLENDRLLTEGRDYTFNYDESKNLITLTPLAGIWQNDRAYRIAVNNQDRSVLVAPSASQVRDGDQMVIIDQAGGEIVFEFESGYTLLLPEAITLVVPDLGTDTGGLSDSDLFTINDGQNPPVVFEFNEPGGTKIIPDSIEVVLPAGPTPTDETDRQLFLNGIANTIRDAIQSQVTAGLLNVDVPVPQGTEVVVGSDPGATVGTELGGLTQLPRTLAFEVPPAGVDTVLGVKDGDIFQVSNGNVSVTFEFDDDGNLNTVSNTPVSIAGLTAANDVAIAISDAVEASSLNLSTSIEGDGRVVYLNLPLQGSANVPQGKLTVVGVSRPALDEDLIIFTPKNTPDSPVVFEINRTDERDMSGNIMDDGVDPMNRAINVTRQTTATQFADLVFNAIQSTSIDGVDPADLRVIDGGYLSIGGSQGLGLAVDADSMEVIGSPSVSQPSTVEVAGPLILNLPLVGGGGIQDGSVLVIVNDIGEDVVFEFNLNGTPSTVTGALQIPYNTFDAVDTISANVVLAVNTANTGVTAVDAGLGSVSFGRIESSRVNIGGIFDPLDPNGGAPGLNGASLKRGIVSDGEVLTITQGGVTVSYEFETAIGGGGVTIGHTPVPFQANSTPGEVAVALASTISNNKFGLDVDPVAEEDENGLPTGRVFLNDVPGTIVDIAQAPTLELSGVPGGAAPIQYSPLFGTSEIKQAMINAINTVNEASGSNVTNLSAVDRGGNTFFVSNAALFLGIAGQTGYIDNFSLPAVKDQAGNPLSPNRSDLSTQFTILMPTARLDYGDTPDPLSGVPGRYPTKNVNDGPRHVVTSDLTLGAHVDANVDGLPGVSANRDDVTIDIDSVGSLFTTSVENGFATILINTPIGNPGVHDGETITIDLGTDQATLEFDVLTDSSGAFDEDNFAIRPEGAITTETIAVAIEKAIAESPLQPADVELIEDMSGTVLGVRLSADDEDGVSFKSFANPLGVLNRGTYTPVHISVAGSGVVEAWIDYNFDGDFDDAGEQVLPQTSDPSIDAIREALLPAGETELVSNIFSAQDGLTERTFNVVVPSSAPVPTEPTTTYMRVRVSRDGGLDPVGLALSGEVEDYPLTILPGLPPSIENDELAQRNYSVIEDNLLVAEDPDGSNSSIDGLLVGIADTDVSRPVIYDADVTVHDMFAIDDNGDFILDQNGAKIIGGTLNLSRFGLFTFTPVLDFNGRVQVPVRVSDAPTEEENTLVNSRPLTVTIEVQPDNDKPFATVDPVEVQRTILEDEVQVFFTLDAMDPSQSLIDGKYLAGPTDELGQSMIIQSAGVETAPDSGVYQSVLGGNVTVSPDGSTVIYTPPLNESGPAVDTFTYQVADVPGNGLLSKAADKLGTIAINFVPVNDPPEANDDNYSTTEGMSLEIPINGPVDMVAGILDNDNAGPDNEDQNLSLVAFDPVSFQNGTITQSNGALVYTPAAFFSGTDRFNYTIEDSENAQATGEVVIEVVGTNSPPIFLGIEGDANTIADPDITRIEAKPVADQTTYDLSTWFRDPENGPLTFQASSSESDVVQTSLTGSTLVLTYPAYGFGTATLTVIATDAGLDQDPNTAGDNLATPQAVAINVINTPDPPQVIGSLNPTNALQDMVVTADLTTVFRDPDGDVLEYQKLRVGDLVNPTNAEILDHELVRAIRFVNDEMIITLQEKQFGSVDIEISATDGDRTVTHTFTLNVENMPDFPVAVDNNYNVSIGSSLQVLDVNDGLLSNDTDADGDSLSVVRSTVSDPAYGDLDVFEDGTFIYTNTSGEFGQVDSFTYRVIDATGRLSPPATVRLLLGASAYQNPSGTGPDGIYGTADDLPGNLESDVNADGLVTGIDALNIVNFLDRKLEDGGELYIPVSDISGPPPFFLDANGDGKVEALDALQVINDLREANSSGELVSGEWVGEEWVGGELPGETAVFGITHSFVSGSTVNLPARHLEPVEASEDSVTVDQVLASGLEITSGVAEQAADAVSNVSGQDTASTPGRVDDALTLLLDEMGDFESK